MAPSVLAPGTSGEVLVGFRVGSSGCWGVETLQVSLEDSSIRIEGNAINSNKPDRACLSVIVYDQQQLMLPALDEGTYDVIAGDLRTTLTVSIDSTSTRENVVYRGPIIFNGCVDKQGLRCALGVPEPILWFTGLPANLDYSKYLVQGEVASENPCENASQCGSELFEKIVAVRTVVEDRLDP